MSRSAVGILVFLALLAPVAAQASPAAWSWNTYTGTSQWQVKITEDDSGCGGGVTSSQDSVTIQHNQGSAVMGDVGHGPATGSFVSANVLHIPARTVSDPPGKSSLSAYDVFFSADCSAFAAKYTWDYSGSDGSCSGTTSLAGTNGNGCPGSAPAVSSTAATIPATPIPSVAPASGEYYAAMLTGPRADLLDYLALCDQRDRLDHAIHTFELQNAGPAGSSPQEPAEIAQDRSQLAQARAQIAAKGPAIENEYKAVLVKDPNNFFANWDLAQLKKSEGLADDSIRYANTAIDNKLSGDAADIIRKDIAQKNNLVEWPTPGNSNIVATVRNTFPVADQKVYGTAVAQGTTEPSTFSNLWHFMIYADPKEVLQDDNLVNKAVYGK